MRYVRKVMRLIFYKPKFLIFSSGNNIIPFKVVPLGSYTPVESLFPLLVAALEVNLCKHLVVSLSQKNKFFTHNIPTVKQANQHCYDLRFAHSTIICLRR